MSLEIIKFAFIAGELSPTFFGRSDLEKFDLGLAQITNWFVDYRGGLTTRPGTIFCEFIKNDDKQVKMFQFKFAPTISNTYVLMFGDGYLRFVQQGNYVLEDAKNITGITKAAIGVVTSVAHGYVNGDWVKFSGIGGMTELNGRTAVVAGATANTFQLRDTRGNNIDTSGYGTYTAGGQVFRVYTLVSPFAATDLDGITVYQRQDLLRITHKDFPPKDLVRVGNTSWTLTDTVFGSQQVAPSSVTLYQQSSGNAEVAFAVTAIDADGQESIATIPVIARSTKDYTTTAGNIKVVWAPVNDAVAYNVYRSAFVSNGSGDLTQGAQLGYLGKTQGSSFVDSNIIPDFSRTPPQHYNPFALGTITSIEVVNQGSGYTDATTVLVTDPNGTGFKGYPIVDIGQLGKIMGVVVQDGGKGYTAPVVSFVTGGTLATATANVSPLTGAYPALSCVFQQRQIYAASINNPLTVWGSRPGQLNNFDTSDIVNEGDSYQFDIDSDEVTPIQHIIPMQGGLLVMSQGGVFQLTGGGIGDAVTALNVLVSPQSYTGVSEVVPIKIDTDLLYVENKGYTVRLLSRNDYSKLYSGEDVSILSNHLFTTSNFITRWSFASDPFKLVWARRLDGALLSFTVVKEQKVFAWAKHFTKGYFEDVLAVQEERTDVVYLIVKRYIGGVFVQYLEQFATRVASHVEDAHCVDSGLALGGNAPASTINISGSTGIVTITALSPVFTAGDMNKVWRGGGGKGKITGYTSTTVVQLTLVDDITDVIPQDPLNTVFPLLQGEWFLDTPIGSVGGLFHLEGQTVKVLLDGNVLPDKVVTNGQVVFGTTGTRAIVGIGYQCLAQSLPLTIQQSTIEGRRKRPVGVAARINQSRGIKYGQTLNKLYTMRERTDEAYGEPTRLIDGTRMVLGMGTFDNDSQVYFIVDDPLPGTLLGYVIDTEVGDDPQ